MPRRKVTPFARFLLAIIIIVPLAFAGASYINGEDPIQNFKQMVGMSESAPQPKAEKKGSTVKLNTADELRKENTRLQKELEQREQAIKDLQKELEACQ